MAIYEEDIEMVVEQLNLMGYAYPYSMRWCVDDIDRVAQENGIDISDIDNDDKLSMLKDILEDRQDIMEQINEDILNALQSKKGESN